MASIETKKRTSERHGLFVGGNVSPFFGPLRCGDGPPHRSGVATNSPICGPRAWQRKARCFPAAMSDQLAAENRAPQTIARETDFVESAGG